MENFDDFTACLELEENESSKRELCERCCRPSRVCWCQYLPQDRLPIATTIVILQHPYEQTRRIQTAKILELALPEEKIKIIKGRKFNPKRTPDLITTFQSASTALLYPSSEAEDLSTYSSKSDNNPIETLIVLDGTWPQAKSMYTSNPALHSIRKVGLLISSMNAPRPSEFVIRRQPSSLCLSTVEAVARALSFLESLPQTLLTNGSLEEVLCRPMLAMCETQLNYGAVIHDPKQTGVAGRRRVVDQDLIHSNEEDFFLS